jgi:hypothetical protein
MALSNITPNNKYKYMVTIRGIPCRVVRYEKNGIDDIYVSCNDVFSLNLRKYSKYKDFTITVRNVDMCKAYKYGVKCITFKDAIKVADEFSNIPSIDKIMQYRFPLKKNIGDRFSGIESPLQSEYDNLIRRKDITFEAMLAIGQLYSFDVVSELDKMTNKS